MITWEKSAAILLCAGESRRFADGDKLLHPLNSMAIVAHAATMLASLPFATRIATVRTEASSVQAILSGLGFTLVPLAAGAEHAESLRAGIKAGLASGAEALCLSLGDMPFVTRDHIAALGAAATPEAPAVTQGPGWTGPPWIASADWVRKNADSLKSALLRDAMPVAPTADIVRDIDTVADLSA